MGMLFGSVADQVQMKKYTSMCYNKIQNPTGSIL